MSLIESKNLLNLNYPVMDCAHDEFAELVNKMESVNNSEFAALFEQLLIHTEQHFEQENTLMLEYKFPALTEHKAEHQRVLNELRQFKKRLDKGLVSFARAYAIEKLPAWFILHLATMDSALVAHINRLG